MNPHVPAIAALTLATAATAQTGVWLADLTDSGDGDGLIEPGERALVTFSIDLEPSVGTEIAPGFTVNSLEGVSPRLTGHGGFTTGASAVVWVNSFMLSLPGVPVIDEGGIGFTLPLFNQLQTPDSRDPIPLFTWEWQPADYTPREVAYAMEAASHEPWLPDGQIQVRYNIYPNETIAFWPLPDSPFSFQVVPAPSGAAALVLSLALARRRR